MFNKRSSFCSRVISLSVNVSVELSPPSISETAFSLGRAIQESGDNSIEVHD